MASGGLLRRQVGNTRPRRYRPGGAVGGPTRTRQYSSGAMNRPGIRGGSVLTSVILLSVQVRVATVDDAEAVAVVHVRSWQSAYRGLIPDAYLDTLSFERRSQVWSRILTETDLPRTGTFVLQDGLDVIGFVHVAPRRDDDLPASTGEVTGIYLTPNAWGRGGGRQLMDATQAQPYGSRLHDSDAVGPRGQSQGSRFLRTTRLGPRRGAQVRRLGRLRAP